MKLQELLYGFTDTQSLPDLFVDNIQYDIEACSPNSVLFYFSSHKYKNKVNYQLDLTKAIEAKVALIVLDSSDIFYDDDEIKLIFQEKIKIVSIVNLYKKIPGIAAQFYQFPNKKLKIIGVTGTNGKTSISHFIAKCLSYTGYQSAVIGSLGYGNIDFKLNKDQWTDYRKGYTTPHPIDLYRTLHHFVKLGIQMVTMEVTSHSMAWHSLVGLEFETLVFTNIGPDHLEFHGVLYHYVEAKKMLFDQKLFPNTKSYVINANDRIGKSLIKTLGNKTNIYTYNSHRHLDQPYHYTKHHVLYADNIKLTINGAKFDIFHPRGNDTVTTNLVGSYYVDNILAVFGVLTSLNINSDNIVKYISLLTVIPGRMQVFYKKGFPNCIVDFAHNPSGITKTLETISNITKGKLICVFGCPGDYNTLARHEIAAIVEKYVVMAIITQSNSYSEDENIILSDIAHGFKNKEKLKIINNRGEAINYAFQHSNLNDTIVVLGKGCQGSIIQGDRVIPHNDVTYIQKLFDTTNYHKTAKNIV